MVYIYSCDAVFFVYLEELSLFCASSQDKADTAGSRFLIGAGFHPGVNQLATAQYSNPTASADLHPGMGTQHFTAKPHSKR